MDWLNLSTQKQVLQTGYSTVKRAVKILKKNFIQFVEDLMINVKDMDNNYSY